MKWFLSGFMLFVLAACSSTPYVQKTDEDASPQAALLNMQLGTGYLKQGRNDLALEKLQKALQQDPNLASAHHSIAFLYERLGEVDAAYEHYEQALDLAPGNPDVHNTYGAFLCRQNRLQDAEREFLAALDDPLYKTPEAALTNAGVCALHIPDKAKAEAYFRRALVANPRFADALLPLAELSLTHDQPLQARAYLQRYAQVAKHTPASLWVGIRTERMLGDKDAVSSYALLLKGDFVDSEEAKLFLELEDNEKTRTN